MQCQATCLEPEGLLAKKRHHGTTAPPLYQRPVGRKTLEYGTQTGQQKIAMIEIVNEDR